MFVTDLDKREQTKSLDADSSKDLRELLTHSNDESETTTVKQPVTKHLSHNNQSSKGHSKSKTAVTKLSRVTDTSSSQTLMMPSKAVKNESFLQASLGEINPVTQQTRLSSVISDITPQEASLTPAQDAPNNVTGMVSVNYLSTVEVLQL